MQQEKTKSEDGGEKMKAASFALILGVLASVSAMPAAAATNKKDIVDTAVAAGTFKTLATALQAAGLVDTLKAKGHSLSLLQLTRRSASCRRARSIRF
jgi:uncharacterized surface protein with fasciclin (FAS1) repeats